MTIKHTDVTYAMTADYGYLPEQPDGGLNWYHPTNVLAAIRHVLRDRSDCDQIPVVIGVVELEVPNQYGHNFFIDVQYAKRGYRAVYAATVSESEPMQNFTCYMD